MPSARRMTAIASVPLPTPMPYEALHAAANSASKASTSGPRMNHPLASTRSRAERTAAASSRGAGALHGILGRVTPAPFLDRSIDVAIEMLPIERHRALQPVGKCHGWRPTGGLGEFRGIGVEIADVDQFFLLRPLDVFNAARSGNLHEQCGQVTMGDRLIAADVEE